MLRLIMDSAIHWIKAGLELKTLKIVLFSRHPEKHDKSHEPLFECFQEMNDQYGDKELTYVSLNGVNLARLTYVYLIMLNLSSSRGI